jgi:hypothetical protein
MIDLEQAKQIKLDKIAKYLQDCDNEIKNGVNEGLPIVFVEIPYTWHADVKNELSNLGFNAESHTYDSIRIQGW